jgi:hypothetical protein
MLHDLNILSKNIETSYFYEYDLWMFDATLNNILLYRDGQYWWWGKPSVIH